MEKKNKGTEEQQGMKKKKRKSRVGLRELSRHFEVQITLYIERKVNSERKLLR